MDSQICRSCAQEYNKEMPACPHCGTHRNPNIPNYPRMGGGAFMTMWIFFVVLIVTLLISMFSFPN